MKLKKILFVLTLISAPIITTGCNNTVFNNKQASLSVVTDGYGNVVADKYSGSVGDTITITITPNQGYSVKEAYFNNIEVQVKNNKCKVTFIKEGDNEFKITFKKTGDSSDSGSGTTEEGGYTKLTNKGINYENVGESSGSITTPSTGNSKIIIVPVQFSDLSTKWTDTRLNSLDVASKGTSNTYWESLESYYNKTSYGKLNLDISIADVITPTMTASNFTSLTDEYGTETLTLIDEIYSKITVDGENVANNYTKYDSNNDDYIDGIWFIYNEFDMDNVDSDKYWAYTYWYYTDSDRSTSLDDCAIGTFANMAAAFLYEQDNNGYDAHTLIHETGHMLGLDDYYSYDSIDYGYLGGLDMMDFNIGDHNAFSKYALNWVNPHLINSNSGRVTLKPFESSGDCLIIPSSYFNNSAFSEYLIIEYYTPTGLNKLDSSTNYGNYPKFFSESGLLIYHVDARLYQYKYQSGEYTLGNVLSSSYTSIPETSGYNYYSVASSNTQSYQNNGNALVTLLGRDKVSYYNNTNASNKSLFKQGDKITSSSFNKNAFSKFNTGSSMNYTLNVESITNENAIITFSK